MVPSSDVSLDRHSHLQLCVTFSTTESPRKLSWALPSWLEQGHGGVFDPVQYRAVPRVYSSLSWVPAWNLLAHMLILSVGLARNQRDSKSTLPLIRTQAWFKFIILSHLILCFLTLSILFLPASGRLMPFYGGLSIWCLFITMTPLREPSASKLVLLLTKCMER